MVTLNSPSTKKGKVCAARGALDNELPIVYFLFDTRRARVHADAAALFAGSTNENAIENHALTFLRPSTLALFSHGLNFLEVLRAALGGCLAATATEGNGCGVFLCHTQRLQKAVAVCKRELCINSHNN